MSVEKLRRSIGVVGSQYGKSIIMKNSQKWALDISLAED